MRVCPVCGFDPEPPMSVLSTAELRRCQREAHLMKNALQSWWVSQPKMICSWLRDVHKISPSAILDIGCGDGRWYPAIEMTWPQAHYTGIDRAEDHILNNREVMEDVEWIFGDVTKHQFNIKYDTALLGGTLNPLMDEEGQDRLFAKIIYLAPRHVVCLFDLKQTGIPPDEYLRGAYDKLPDVFIVPMEERDIRQDLVVWVYERT